MLLVLSNKGKECRARVSSRQWGGSLRDDPNNGCEGDYFSPGPSGLEEERLFSQANGFIGLVR